jgi:MFS family permease
LLILFAGQFLIGFGAGTLGVTRSYVAENSNKQNRTGKMALLTAMQYAGFTVMPLLGSLLAYIASENILTIGFIEISEYNIAAFMLAFLAFIEAMTLVFIFKEQPRKVVVSVVSGIIIYSFCCYNLNTLIL